MPEIEIKNLYFSYRDGNNKIDALRGVELHIRDGEFVCVLGPSGCGKSTLLRLLAGLEKPDNGYVSIDGRPVEGTGSDRMIVFQDYALFPWQTAEKNVSFALRRGKGLSKAEAKEKALSYLEKLGMGEHASLYPFQLSGGMRQRVAIARALAMDTDILLLDEPFGALDARNREEIQQLLLQLWQSDRKKTVVFVTHDVSEAMLLADRIVFMEPGRVKAEFTVDAARPRDEDEALKARLLELFQEVGR